MPDSIKQPVAAPKQPWWAVPVLAFMVALVSRWALSSYLFHSGQMPLGFAASVSRMLSYDAQWHWYIAHHGYAKVEGPLHYAELITHYSLVWPKLLSVSLLFGEYSLLAAIVLNCLIFSAAAATLARIAVVCNLDPWKPVSLFCCYPTSFFANSVYNEPIFLLLTFLSMLMLLRGRLFLAFFLDAAAISIRVNAFANVVATIFSAIRAKMSLRRFAIAAAALATAASIQPIAVWYHRGSPTANWEDFDRIQWMANPQPMPFKDQVQNIQKAIAQPSRLHSDDMFTYNDFWPSVSLFTAVLLFAAAWKFCPPPVRVQGLATIIGLSLLEQAISTPRYLMSFTPMYFLAARSPSWVVAPVCILMGWAQLHLVSRFVRQVWAF